MQWAAAFCCGMITMLLIVVVVSFIGDEAAEAKHFDDLEGEGRG